jgi:hypothetical protein
MVRFSLNESVRQVRVRKTQVGASRCCVDSQRRVLPPCFFENLNHATQPGRDFFFHHLAALIAVKGMNGLSFRIERNMMAGDSFGEPVLGYQGGQETLVAGVATVGIPGIQASRGILKDRRGQPRRSPRATIIPLLDKFQFGFENLENIPLVDSHRTPPILF